MAQALQQNGYRFQSPMMNLGARPNVYKRSQEAREMTNAYLAEVERKAAGIEEPVPVQMKIKVWQIAAATLAAVGIVVGAFIL